MAQLGAQTGFLGHGLLSGRLINMFVQPTPDGPTKFVLLARPRLKPVRVDGSGPIRVITQALGATYVLSGTDLYRNGVNIGSLTFGGQVQTACSDTEMVITSGWKAYAVQGSTITQITGIPQVSGVVYLGGRFVYIVRNSGQFYWSAIGDATSIDGLSFATAESNPDAIVRAEILGDQIGFFGSESVEWWPTSPDGDLPYERSSGQTYDKGCLAPYTLVKTDNSLFWVGVEETEDESADSTPGATVYRSGAAPVRVSTDMIEAKLALCTRPEDCTAFKVIFKGATFYVLNIPDVGTFAYNIGLQLWSEWASYGLTTFRVGCGSGGLFGDAASGDLWSLGEFGHTDNGTPVVRTCPAFIPVKSGPIRLNNLTIKCVQGVGVPTGQGSDPAVEMRMTDELEGDWSDWMRESLGAQGDRSNRATFWPGGMMDSPGLALEFRCSDPVEFAPFDIGLNEARP